MHRVHLYCRTRLIIQRENIKYKNVSKRQDICQLPTRVALQGYCDLGIAFNPTHDTCLYTIVPSKLMTHCKNCLVTSFKRVCQVTAISLRCLGRFKKKLKEKLIFVYGTPHCFIAFLYFTLKSKHNTICLILIEI